MNRIRNAGTRTVILKETARGIDKVIAWNKIVVSKMKYDQNLTEIGRRLPDLAQVRGPPPVECILDLPAAENDEVRCIKEAISEQMQTGGV